MYFEDESEYLYDEIFVNSKFDIRNVGWLDPSHEYTTGSVLQKDLEKIFLYCSEPVNLTKGVHVCPLCGQKDEGLQVLSHEIESHGKIYMGNGEIWVKSENYIYYAAPTLIYHYILEHGYCPPSDFLDALNTGERVDPESLAADLYNNKNAKGDGVLAGVKKLLSRK